VSRHLACRINCTTTCNIHNVCPIFWHQYIGLSYRSMDMLRMFTLFPIIPISSIIPHLSAAQH
jgi:hypothetical protein